MGKLRFITSILILVLSSLPAFGGGLLLIGPGSAPTACSTPATGDTMNEGFVGSGYELGAQWTETVGSGDSIDEDAALPGCFEAGSCTEGLRLTSTDSANYTSYNHGTTVSTSGDIDWYFTIYIVSASSSLPDAEASNIIISWATSAPSGYAWVIQLDYYTGNWRIRGSGDTDAAYSVITADTCHVVLVHFDQSDNATSYYTVDGGSANYFTIGPYAKQYLHLGPYGTSWGTGDDLDIYFGRVYIDTP